MTVALSILVAADSRAKVSEVRALLEGFPVEVLSADDELGAAAPESFPAATTFADHALAEARAVAEAALMITVADASGLDVDALGGRPGVRSPRFAGEGATDAENNAELLRRLDDVEDEARTARFREAIAVVDPWSPDNPIVVEGRCEGRIARKPSGTGGFGYEPLFIVAGREQTIAELDEGDDATHRNQALRALAQPLTKLVESRLDEALSIVHGTYEPPPSVRG